MQNLPGRNFAGAWRRKFQLPPPMQRTLAPDLCIAWEDLALSDMHTVSFVFAAPLSHWYFDAIFTGLIMSRFQFCSSLSSLTAINTIANILLLGTSVK